jgi:hypothetical protein
VQRKIRVENRTQAAIWALANLSELDAAPRGAAVAGATKLALLLAILGDVLIAQS